MLKRISVLCAALAAMTGLPSIGRAEGTVPGGWSSEVGVHSFDDALDGPDAANVFASRPPAFGSLIPADRLAAGRGRGPGAGFGLAPQVVNGLVPLAETIRRSGRRRPRR
jgi:hypothetical protein